MTRITPYDHLKRLLIQACEEIELDPFIWNSMPEVKEWWDDYRSSDEAWARNSLRRKKARLQKACDQVSKLQDEIETLEKES